MRRPRQALRRDGRPSLGVDLAGVAEALGHRQDGGEGDLRLLGAVVELELESQGRPQVLQAADPTGEGQIQQLGDLGPHLTRLTVDGVAAEEHEIEGAGGTQRGRQRPCGRERVRSAEHLVADVDSRVGPPGHRLAEHVLGARGPEGDDGARASGRARQDDALGHGTSAVHVHLEADSPAHQPPTLEAHRLGDGDLLDERGDPQRDPAARVTGAGLTGGSMRPRYRPRQLVPVALVGSATDGGALGAARVRRPHLAARAAVGADRDDLGAPHGDGVEGPDPLHPVAACGQPVDPFRWRVGLDDHRQVVAPPEAERSGRGARRA